MRSQRNDSTRSLPRRGSIIGYEEETLISWEYHPDEVADMLFRALIEHSSDDTKRRLDANPALALIVPVEFKRIAQRAEAYIRERIGSILEVTLAELFMVALSHGSNQIDSPQAGLDFRKEAETSFLKNLRPHMFNLKEKGRPIGTGLFKSNEDFLLALQDVLGKADKEPSRRQTLHALRQHALCRKPTKKFPSANEAKTLRNWLTRCGYTFEEALSQYFDSQNGK